jgi:hypothetical protein
METLGRWNWLAAFTGAGIFDFPWQRYIHHMVTRDFVIWDVGLYHGSNKCRPQYENKNANPC